MLAGWLCALCTLRVIVCVCLLEFHCVVVCVFGWLFVRVRACLCDMSCVCVSVIACLCACLVVSLLCVRDCVFGCYSFIVWRSAYVVGCLFVRSYMFPQSCVCLLAFDCVVKCFVAFVLV